jgi:hypothetical protein
VSLSANAGKGCRSGCWASQWAEWWSEVQGWFLLYFSSANFFIFYFLFHSSISNLNFIWDFVLVWIIHLFELLGLLLRGIYHPLELFEIEFEAI